MEGPSLPGANSITYPPSPGNFFIHPRESELEMAFRVLRVGRRFVKVVTKGRSDERDGEPNARTADCAKLAGEDGKYRMMKLESRKARGASRT